MVSHLICGLGANMGRNPSRDPHIQGKRKLYLFVYSEFSVCLWSSKVIESNKFHPFPTSYSVGSLEMVQIVLPTFIEDLFLII